MKKIRGITWDHARGFDPMVATARAFNESHPGVEIMWEKRSLQAFADQPIDELAREYDLLVIDHPHVGEVAGNGCLVALNTVDRNAELAVLASESLGQSHASYEYGGHQWALAIDAAALVAAYRPDLLDTPPTKWEEVVELAKAGRVLWPIKPVDAISSYFTLAANLGSPCGSSGEQLIERDAGLVVLQAMRALADHVPAQCLAMNPILTLEQLATDDTFLYCPLLYGYNNYARPGYHDHVIRFANIPSLGHDGPCGANLGGTGIAVSSHCAERDLAVEYAFWIASAVCQRGLYFESGGQPGNAVAWSDSSVNQAANGFFNDTRETMDRSYLRPRHHGYMVFQDRGGDIVNDFLAKRIDELEAQSRLDAAYRESFNSSASH